MGVRVPPFAPKVKKWRIKVHKICPVSDLEGLSLWVELDISAQ